jgi:hypothetical protein
MKTPHKPEKVGWKNYYELFSYSPNINDLFRIIESIPEGLSAEVENEASVRGIDFDEEGKLEEYIEVLADVVLTYENESMYKDSHKVLDKCIDDWIEYVNQRQDELIKEWCDKYGEKIFPVGARFDTPTGYKWIVKDVRHDGKYDMKSLSWTTTCIRRHSDLCDITRFIRVEEEDKVKSAEPVLNFNGLKDKVVWQKHNPFTGEYDTKTSDFFTEQCSFCGVNIHSLNPFGESQSHFCDDCSDNKGYTTKNPCNEIFLKTPTLNKSENKMSTIKSARIVNVSILDNSQGIKDDSDRLVARYKDVTTTKTDQQIQMEILMGKGVAEKIAAHNKVRFSLIDEDILNRTGNEVTLRAIELHDLTWVITGA